MLRVLFIEDEPNSVEPAIRFLNKDGEEYACEVKDFSEAEKAIKSFMPDVIVLDLLAGGSSSEPKTPGLETYDFIWNSRFCPIVVYSAQPDILKDAKGPHPFVKTVQKGRDSNKDVKTAISEMLPQVEALRSAEGAIRQEFASALAHVAPYAFNLFPDSSKVSERNDMIIRAGRRRLAALMDALSRDGQILASWEQYLWPPVCDDLQLGDILHEAGHENSDPTSFRVVLTPSCDLVASGKRSPKVKNVLVAHCRAIKDGIQQTSLGNIKAAKLKEKLESTMLSQGFFETMLPFPALPGRIPHMAADLRDLELIPLEQLIGKDPKFERAASIDSPFRELVAWAYMQIACRPGMPDRDFKEWCEGIISAYEESDKSEVA